MHYMALINLLSQGLNLLLRRKNSSLTTFNMAPALLGDGQHRRVICFHAISVLLIFGASQLELKKHEEVDFAKYLETRTCNAA